ncbi:MAG TPA: hypothetical protein VGD81_05520 [Opitutaceae bacterium]
MNTNLLTTPKALLAALLASALFLTLNGLFMLFDPGTWYDVVPGVKFTGPFNQHFVRDIGIIQAFLGVAYLVGVVRPAVRLELWAAATVWLIAHALFHLWEVAVGICAPSALLRDFGAVSLPALIGLWASAWAWRRREQPATALAVSEGV